MAALAPGAEAAAAASASRLHVLVTGGSSGIGAACVRALLARGHRVFATGRNGQALAKLQSELAEQHGQEALRTSAGDVADEADVSRQLEEALAFFSGRLDATVLNAGCAAGRHCVEDVPLEAFDRVMSTNVRGVFAWMQAALRVMKPQRRGQIVVTSSIAAMRACPTTAVYAASKAAVQGLVLSLRAELKGTGVKVGTVNPGPVATEWWLEEHRGGYSYSPDNEFERSERMPFWASMLSPQAVSDAILSLVEQAASSNIESVVLDASDFGGVAPPGTPAPPGAAA